MKRFHQPLLGFLMAGFLASQAFAAMDYVSAPDSKLTPGAFCARPNSYRFQERIPYCDRNVDSSTKRLIIQIYDQQLGTRIAQMPRDNFKIDHLVPLCIGGSNEMTNLWPQHKSTFVITDKIEQITCDMMGRGDLMHNEAVEYVTTAKRDPRQAMKILEKLSR